VVERIKHKNAENKSKAMCSCRYLLCMTKQWPLSSLWFGSMSDLVVITCLMSVFSGGKHSPDSLCAMYHSQILFEICYLRTKSLVMRKHFSRFSEERIEGVCEEDADGNIWT
jgi:hypothetical protein